MYDTLITAPNRFFKGAMTERLSSWHPTDLLKRGGLGNILTGNMIELDHSEAAGNPIVPRTEGLSDPRFEAFKELATAAKKEGSSIIGQVSHPGRQVESRIQKNPISASDVQPEGSVIGMTFNKPRAVTQEDISKVIEGFAHAAEYLEKTGYDGIQLHGTHGYLLAQFMSETTNKRTDKYGGSIANRARLIVEITEAIRKRIAKSFVLGIKLNSLSGDTYEELTFVHKRESTKKREAFFMEFADLIVPALKETKAYVTGGFRSVGAMVDALKTVDGIGLARPVCQEPRLAKDILSGKVNAVIHQQLEDSDFGVVAGNQIRQMGKD
ncbi:FMN-linked oxidoreductase [Zopfia rhizophila CBS 207.26]|uniref:FMN-linked oxidoreductase n=1 Tax=Zopfia rhizophila CBS 207.26 TaxID=1314779 RepID=A0A6A6E7F8_9PEZI|nr:FMN-linked oxidoreductase [Zopfia rhizophila CBS 207.26]